MTHAVADVVLVEQFRIVPGADGMAGWIRCPDPRCLYLPGDPTATLGALLTAARRHILEDHPGGDPLAREHAYTAALHAVDNTAGDEYPGFIPELLLPAERPGRAVVNECQRCGRTVRGPLFPIQPPGMDRLMVGPGCFRAHRRNASHIPDPLPMPGGEEGDEHG